MAFTDIVGNPRIKNILSRAMQRQKLPNSLLFIGPAGVGKLNTAMVVAKALNCLQRVDDACETCSSCRGINKGGFPDVMLVEREQGSLLIEQMRVLKDTAYLKPMIGKRRVFIINEAEKMNISAANSLLKVLEEPPPLSYIILITSNPYLILPTIKSRCQTLNFSYVAREDIVSSIKENGFNQDQAEILALHAGGNLERAKSLSWEEIQALKQTAWALFSALLRGEGAASFLQKNSNRQRGSIQEEVAPLLEMLASFCRDVLLLQKKCDPAGLMNPDYADEVAGIARTNTSERILSGLAAIDNTVDALERNVNIKLIISSLLINFQEEKYV